MVPWDTHTYTQKQAPPYIHHDCCDGAKNGYCSCDAYLGVFGGSLTM
jgi:hypothetical protein